MEQNRDVLIIGVIYNTYPEVLRFLNSALPFLSQGTDILLVDNSEKNVLPEFAEFLENHPDILYLHSASNCGYFRAAAIGLEHYRKNHDAWPLWIMVTNVDIVFTDPETIRKIKNFEADARTGILAPAIISSRWGTDYNPKIPVRYPVQKMRFYKRVYQSVLISNAYQLLSYAKKLMQGRVLKNKGEAGQVPVKIYGPHGSCMIFHRNYFTRGGTLDHISFLFGEEIFVAESAMRLGLDVIYAPRIRITDHEHSSTGMFLSRRMNSLYLQSTVDILRVYYGINQQNQA